MTHATHDHTAAYINSGLALSAETKARIEGWAGGHAPMIVDADPAVWAPETAAQPEFGDRFTRMWEAFHADENTGWFFVTHVASILALIAVALWMTN